MAHRWTRAHEEQVARILALMRREARPFADASPEAVAARRQLPFADWCHLYLPHWFQVADAPFHELADARRNDQGMPSFDCWARGTGKTTRYSIADPLYDIVGRRLTYIVLGAKTLDSAAEKADMIRLELRHNARLRADYGEQIAPREGSDAEDRYVACDTCVRCVGTGQSLRGAIHAGHRPQKFVGDDLEDWAIARSRDREAKLEDWLLGDVYPALEGAGQEAVCRVLGNMYGRHCQAVGFSTRAEEADAQGRPLAVYRRFPLLGDDDGESTWRARYSTEAVRRAMAIVGPLRARTEYLCLVADEESPFQPPWFRRLDLRAISESRIAAMRKAAYLDPSATAAETSDYKAWVVLGREDGSPNVYCLHAWIRRAAPEEQLRELFRILDRFPGVQLAAERNGFQRLLWNLLALLCESEGRTMPAVRGVLNTANKLDRILQWQGEFQMGRCYFDPREGDQQRLIDQFCDLPKGAHDDGPDAWDGARRLLGGPARGAEAPEPTRRDILREAGIESWMDAENPAIWAGAEL